MKKTILLLFCLAMTLVLAACSAGKADKQGGQSGDGPASASASGVPARRVEYGLGDEFTDVFTQLPREARPGDTVELRTEILFDADVHVYVDGQEIGKTHYDGDQWVYSFTMPDKDVTVTARFYTEDEIWGTAAADEDALREKYPEYFDLGTFKGLEVYVWQMAPGSWSCGVMSGTNREKTLEELMGLRGASVEEMRVILSGYDIPKEDICVIPWQNPASSYIGEYWAIGEDEDPDAVSERRQEYVDWLREALLSGEDARTDPEEVRGGDDERSDLKEVCKVAYANWTDDSRVFSCLNAEKLAAGAERHLPVYRIDTEGDLDLFREKFGDVLTLDQGYGEVPSFNDAVCVYDESFFARRSLILAYVAASSGSLRFDVRDVIRDGSSLCLYAVQTNDPEVCTADMAGWFVMAEVRDEDLENVADYDARLAAGSDELPGDLAFSIVWGCYGVSSYDSETGVLIKTKDATDVSKYTCRALLPEETLAEVYRLLTDIDIFGYPDSYDPFNAPDAEVRMESEPNQTVVISFTANGREKTVACEGIAFGSPEQCYCEEARAFMEAQIRIVKLITSLPEWEAFPDYEFYYE